MTIITTTTNPSSPSSYHQLHHQPIIIIIIIIILTACYRAPSSVHCLVVTHPASPSLSKTHRTPGASAAGQRTSPTDSHCLPHEPHLEMTMMIMMMMMTMMTMTTMMMTMMMITMMMMTMMMITTGLGRDDQLSCFISLDPFIKPSI